ncbi:MAG: hypothetical protein COB14_08895 [Alphaproteobacteria bacterium]|nr:MAG: hypothetical protein COB14_08895 [Alphaproteobacteria bacterium]
MIALNQDFNSRADSIEANNVLYEQMLSDANPNTLAEYDDFFRRNGNDSNEGALSVLRDSMDAAGGKAGTKLAGLGKLIDKNMEGRDAADTSKSSNVSQGARIVEDNLLDEQIAEDLNYDTPEMAAVGHTEADLEVAIATVYEQLLSAGVPETDLNHAMAAGGVDDPRATVEMFFDLAENNNIPMTGYIQDVDLGLMNLQLENGEQDVTPVVGIEEEAPVMAMEFDDFAPVIQPDEPTPMRLG